ncbi:MAG TPA: Hpt domain-containing protein, partial [Steroidobacteraceae bacterium]
MSIDLTQFHDGFYEESFEAIGQMEEALLRLDVGTPDLELINTIFRVAHSIKGGAATFGFSEITSFTHTLETLLDELRGQRMQVTTALSDLLLRSVDVMREMLRAQQGKQPIDAQRVADLQFDLELTVVQKGTAAAATAAKPAAPAPAATKAMPSADCVRGTLYQIRFRPFLHLLARGNDPLRMFRELRELGDLQVSADLSAMPAFEEFDPENCYLSWTLQLRTEAARQSVVEVFDWAEGDCTLEVSELASASAATLAAMPAVVGEPAARTPLTPAAPIAGAAAPGRPALGAHAEERESRPAKAAEAAKGSDASSIRVSIEKIDDLMNSVGELVITQSMLGQFGALLDGTAGERLRSGLAQLERNVREIQESVMRVRMVPISFVFSRFPRMVRDLSQRLGKQVELKMTGGETELDKTVLEKIGDPLVHLVRNSIDH